MLWADTTAGIMKMRNGANSAWISLWELDGTFIATDISLSAGTAGAPSLYFTGDTNTGIYSPGADQVAISSNGQGRLYIDASGNVGVGVTPSAWNTDYRAIQLKGGGALSNDGGNTEIRFSQNAFVDSGATNRYIASAAASRYRQTSGVHLWETASSGTAGNAITFNEGMRLTPTGLGIGNSSPNETLHVNGAIRFTSSSPALAASDGGLVDWVAASGELRVTAARTGANSSKITFITYNSGSLVQAATIDSAGRLGIGSTVPESDLHILKSAATPGIILERTTSATAKYKIAAVSGALTFEDLAAAQERFRCDSSGRLLVGTSSARANFYNSTNTPALQIEGNDNNKAALSIVQDFNAATQGAQLILAKNNSTTIGTNVLVANENNLGIVSFQGNDGAEFVEAASIQGIVDGTPGANDMPGRLVFSTTADGASSPTERLRITNAGYLKASNLGSYISSTGKYHEFRANGNSGDWTMRVQHTDGSGGAAGIYIQYPSQAPNNTTSQFLTCGDSSATRAEIRSNGGLANFSANNANLSDINTKKDISPADRTWDCIKEWEIVNYRYKDQPDDADLNLGVIAQQVAESCPEVITIFQEAKEATEDAPAQEERLGVKEQQMYWMAIKALQEAQVRIEQLESKVAALESA